MGRPEGLRLPFNGGGSKRSHDQVSLADILSFLHSAFELQIVDRLVHASTYALHSGGRQIEPRIWKLWTT